MQDFLLGTESFKQTTQTGAPALIEPELKCVR